MGVEYGSDIISAERLKEWCRQWDEFYSDKRKAIDRIQARNRRKRKREVKYKMRLKFLAECSNYPHPAYPIDKYGNYIAPGDCEKIAYYRRCYRGNHKNSASCYYKKRANRMVRRYQDEIHKGAAYRKCFDYWWTLY